MTKNGNREGIKAIAGKRDGNEKAGNLEEARVVIKRLPRQQEQRKEEEAVRDTARARLGVLMY